MFIIWKIHIFHIEDDGQTLCGKPLKAGNPPIEQEYTPIGLAKVYAMKDVMDNILDFFEEIICNIIHVSTLIYHIYNHPFAQ
jgi:hypothetical protein